MTGRKRFEWTITLVVGVALIFAFLNRGVLFRQYPNTTAAFTITSHRASLVEADAAAHTILAKMSLDDKLGQLIIPMSSDTSMNADMSALITKYHIGGYFIPGYSATASELHDFIQQMQAASPIPLIIATDFEGGGWNTLASEVGQRPYPSVIGASGNTNLAYQKGVTDAKLLTELGLNVDFAPSVDVLTNPDNPILQGRTFGSNPGIVTAMASAYIDGLSSGGIAGTLKHFPGLGASTVDPHKALPTVNLSLQEMESVDLVPYKQLIQANRAPMIMTTHMLIPSLDPDLPTSISPLVINGLLRQQLGYQGVVVSDALFMGGLSYKYDIPTAALMAFKAGTDLLLGILDANQAEITINLFKHALSSGDITLDQLDASVLRILVFKLQWGIIPINSPLTTPTPSPSANGPIGGIFTLADVRPNTMAIN